MKRGILAVAALLCAASLFGQQGPAEGKWWKRPRIAAELQLSADQTAALEKIFARSRPKIIDLKADLEKKQFEYQQALEDERADRQIVAAKIEAREEARARLQKELALMELDMREVLHPDQRERLMRMREAWRQVLQERRRRLREGNLNEEAPPPKKKR
ncbi:MAG TPA: periplasmic heavy metal sensor [Thermoanaerobaculia bacterium]